MKILNFIFCLLLTNTISFCQIPTDGLVGYYPFNNNVNDESGNGNNAINIDAIFTTDRFGNINSAASFNGKTSEIILPEAFHLGDTFTVCGWAFALTAQYNSGCLFQSDWSRQEYYYEPFLYSVYAFFNNEEELNCNSWGGNNIIENVDSLEWFFWALSCDGSTLKVYLNDELKTSHSVTPNYGIGTYFPARIGRITRNTNAAHGDLQNYWFNGSIDDVRIYNRTLSDIEIESLFHEGGWQGGKHITIEFTNGGEQITGAKVLFRDFISTDISEFEIKIDNLDITNLCYVGPDYITTPGMILTPDFESATLTVSIQTALKSEIEESVEISKADNFLDEFYSIKEDIPIREIENFANEHEGAPFSDLIDLTDIFYSLHQGNDRKATESSIQLLIKQIPWVGTIDFLVDKSLGMILFREIPEEFFPEGEYEHFNDDMFIVKYVKSLTYSLFNIEKWLITWDPLTGRFKGERTFSPNVPGTDDLYDWLGGITDALDGINNWVDEEWSKFMAFFGFSPIDLLIVTASGDSLSSNINTIPFSTYIERESAPLGEWEDYCLIYDTNMEDFTIKTIKEPNVSETDTYSIIQVVDTDTTIIAQNTKIKDAPIEGYKFSNGIWSYITNHIINSGMIVYPIPANDITFIEFPNPEHSEYKLFVTDMTGKVVRLIDNITEDRIELRRNDLSDGIYFVKLQGAKTFQGKLVLK